MPVTDLKKDLDALTMTITADFVAGAGRVWEMWSDPRQLERWWGPPSHPATFAKGASLDDPAGLFNASLEASVRRAIDLREGDAVDPVAFKDLVRAAVGTNVA